MSLDGIKPAEKFLKEPVQKEEKPSEQIQAPIDRPRDKKKSNKKILWLFVGLMVFVIFVFWLIFLKYSFSDLSDRIASSLELEKAKQSLSRVLDDFTNEIDKLKQSKVFNRLDLSDDKVKNLEERLEEAVNEKEKKHRP